MHHLEKQQCMIPTKYMILRCCFSAMT